MPSWSKTYLLSFWILLQIIAGCLTSASDVCSLANNPCLTAVETSRELNFMYGLSESQLRTACDIFGKSIHCLDYSLRSCTAVQKDLMMTYVKHIRVTMDRLCNDEITRTAFLAYSPCFKKAYARTEYCLNYFLLSIRNSTLASGGSSTGSSPKSQGALPLEDFMCDALSNMTTCVHNAVKCKENSSRDIKDVLNLMLRGGLSTSLLQQCYPVGKKPNHAHVARSSAPSVRSPGCIKVNFQQSCLYLSLWIILGVSLFLNSFPTAQLYNCIS